MVQNPTSLTLDEIRARPRQEYVRTLECSGNGASPRTNNGLIGNARWAGTRLAPILRERGLDARALEVVFFGADHGTEELRGDEYEQHFIRSLHVDRASQDDILLLYEMNGDPLPFNHGGPLRLGVPGWYGVAWVKWLSRIEIHDRRYVSRYMSRDYVTIRGETQGEKVIWRQTLVGPMNLKSIVARVVRRPEGVLRVTGAAWGDGTPLRAVELKVDDGPWRRTQFTEGRDVPHTWTFWSYDWRDSQPGEHTLVSRAIDVTGRIQPSADESLNRHEEDLLGGQPAVSPEDRDLMIRVEHDLARDDGRVRQVGFLPRVARHPIPSALAPGPHTRPTRSLYIS